MAWLRQIPKHEVSAEVERATALVRLDDHIDLRIKALSGGMRRRVGIASAIIGKPGLVILDEPSAGLDVGQREVLRDITRELSRDAVVVVSTHIIEDILDAAETVTVMDGGRLVSVGTRHDFAPEQDLRAFERRYLELVSGS